MPSPVSVFFERPPQAVLSLECYSQEGPPSCFQVLRGTILVNNLDQISLVIVVIAFLHLTQPDDMQLLKEQQVIFVHVIHLRGGNQIFEHTPQPVFESWQSLLNLQLKITYIFTQPNRQFQRTRKENVIQAVDDTTCLPLAFFPIFLL